LPGACEAKASMTIYKFSIKDNTLFAHPSKIPQAKTIVNEELLNTVITSVITSMCSIPIPGFITPGRLSIHVIWFH
jgi:hypothetical protein